MMISHSILVSTAALGAVLATASMSHGHRTAAPDYFPVDPGNTWTLRDTQNGQDRTRVARVTHVWGGKHSEVVTLKWTTDGLASDTEVDRVSPHGVQRMSAGSQDSGRLDPPLPILEYPLRPGLSWSWKGTLLAQGRSIRADASFTTSGPTPVRTAAGDFRAIRVHMDLTLHAEDGQSIVAPSDYWFAPGVGLVQQHSQVGSLVISDSVVSFRVKKAEEH